MIDDHTSGQHDPIDLLHRLINNFDQKSSKPIHHAVFSFSISVSLACPMGHNGPLAAEEESLPILMVYPARAFSDGTDANVFSLISDAVRHSHDSPVSCQTCGSLCQGDMTPRFRHLGDQLAIHVVWPLLGNSERMSGQDSRSQFSSKSFRISKELDLLPLTDQSIRRNSVSASLTGILCQVGRYIDRGHYISLVPVNDSWWRIDDERVSHVYTLNEVFENGCSPILLLYRVVVIKAPTTLRFTVNASEIASKSREDQKSFSESKLCLFME